MGDGNFPAARPTLPESDPHNMPELVPPDMPGPERRQCPTRGEEGRLCMAFGCSTSPLSRPGYAVTWTTACPWTCRPDTGEKQLADHIKPNPSGSYGCFDCALYDVTIRGHELAVKEVPGFMIDEDEKTLVHVDRDMLSELMSTNEDVKRFCGLFGNRLTNIPQLFKKMQVNSSALAPALLDAIMLDVDLKKLGEKAYYRLGKDLSRHAHLDLDPALHNALCQQYAKSEENAGKIRVLVQGLVSIKGQVRGLLQEECEEKKCERDLAALKAKTQDAETLFRTTQKVGEREELVRELSKLSSKFTSDGNRAETRFKQIFVHLVELKKAASSEKEEEAALVRELSKLSELESTFTSDGNRTETRFKQIFFHLVELRKQASSEKKANSEFELMVLQEIGQAVETVHQKLAEAKELEPRIKKIEDDLTELKWIA